MACQICNKKKYEHYDKHKNICKECYKTQRRKYNHSKAGHERDKRMRMKYKAKYRARRAAAYAIETGKLKKKPCVLCGAKKVEAHHPDYSQPLYVLFLCVRHHTSIHHPQKYEAR